MEKECFEALELELIRFESGDVLTTSGPDIDNGGAED